jgi:hypothetical protein
LISWRIENKLLRPCGDPRWMEKMSFQGPKRITVDNGRDTKAMLDLLAAGGTTLQDIYLASGENYRAKMRQWIREPLEFIRIAKEEGASPALIARWEANLPLWRAHATGAAGNEGTTKDAKDAKEEGGNPEEEGWR